MLSEQLLQQLASENELLQVQLQDLNYMIEAREEELLLLRKAAANGVRLQSKLDANLFEIEQLQSLMEESQQQANSAMRREANMEDEMMMSLQMEKDFYQMKDQFSSTQIALEDVNLQMREAVAMYQEVSDLRKKIVELESQLEIAQIDNTYLKEELEETRKQLENPATQAI